MRKYVFVFVILAINLLCYYNVSANESEYIVKIKDYKSVEMMNVKSSIEPLVPELGLYITSDVSNTDMFEFVEYDAPVELFETYNYDEFMLIPEYFITGIKSMWDIGVYGNDVRIGVIDSGCNPHKALTNNLKDGASFVDESIDTYDNIGHGTAVCGVAAGEYGFGKCIGTAHKAEIIPLKFIDKDSEGRTIGGTTSKLVKAIISAVDDFDCDIINMSCGTIDSLSLKTAVDYAADKGVILVAAVGNDGTSKYNYPAAYDNVLGVGSINSKKECSDFSNKNDSVFVTAPGENVNVLLGTGSIAKGTGTSFSAPYIGGIIADMKTIKPKLQLNEIKSILSETAEDLGDKGYDTEYGCVLVRADNITEYMLKECECFISEIDLCSDGFNEIRVRVNNETEKPTIIFAGYKGKNLNQICTDMIEIEDNVYVLRIPNMVDNMYQYFVWDSMNNIQPVNFNNA